MQKIEKIEKEIFDFSNEFCLDLKKKDACELIKRIFKNLSETYIEKVYNAWRNWIRSLKLEECKTIFKNSRGLDEVEKTKCDDYKVHVRHYSIKKNLELKELLKIYRYLQLGLTKREMTKLTNISYNDITAFKSFLKNKKIVIAPVSRLEKVAR